MDDALKNKQEKDYKKGKEREIVFIGLMAKNEYRCYSATSRQDKEEQWDVLAVKDIENNQKLYERFNVKGLKEGVNEGFAWIELHTSDNRKGWLYSEYMDTIAFEIEECFLFVNRAELVPIIEGNIEKEDIRAGCKETYYIKETLQYYQRYYRRGDITIKAPFKDFEHLVNRRLYKNGRLV